MARASLRSGGPAPEGRPRAGTSATANEAKSRSTRCSLLAAPWSPADMDTRGLGGSEAAAVRPGRRGADRVDHVLVLSAWHGATIGAAYPFLPEAPPSAQRAGQSLVRRMIRAVARFGFVEEIVPDKYVTPRPGLKRAKRGAKRPAPTPSDQP